MPKFMQISILFTIFITIIHFIFSLSLSLVVEDEEKYLRLCVRVWFFLLQNMILCWTVCNVHAFYRGKKIKIELCIKDKSTNPNIIQLYFYMNKPYISKATLCHDWFLICISKSLNISFSLLASIVWRTCSHSFITLIHLFFYMPDCNLSTPYLPPPFSSLRFSFLFPNSLSLAQSIKWNWNVKLPSCVRYAYIKQFLHICLLFTYLCIRSIFENCIRYDELIALSFTISTFCNSFGEFSLRLLFPSFYPVDIISVSLPMCFRISNTQMSCSICVCIRFWEILFVHQYFQVNYTLQRHPLSSIYLLSPHIF